MRCRTLPVLALSLAACQAAPKIIPAYDPVNSPIANGSPAAPEVTEPPRTAAADAMHRWLLELSGLRDAAVQGDLPAIKDGASRWVAGLDRDVPQWREAVQGIRTEGQRLAAAQTMFDAAASVGRLAASCGACHESRGISSDVDEGLPADQDPPPGERSRDAMEQHAWAANRMWEGLVAPSVPRWIRGTTMFAILPECPDDEAVGSAPNAKRCERARALARRARLAEEPAARASLYGRLLATCAECHTSATALTRASTAASPQ